jgi:hypothetical protein
MVIFDTVVEATSMFYLKKGKEGILTLVNKASAGQKAGVQKRIRIKICLFLFLISPYIFGRNSISV